MSPLKGFRATLIRNRIYMAHLGLLVLFLLGLMNVIYILGFREPSDGVIWQPNEDDALVATGFVIEGEVSEKLQVGDILITINDEPIEASTDYYDFIEEAMIGGTYLYQVSREGRDFSHWIQIRGTRDPDLQRYYPQALTGFLYLVFLMVILGQEVTFGSRGLLAFFCLCVFLQLAFQDTTRFALLDWVVLLLDRVGELLLPSALAAVLVSRSLAGSRWQPFVQALHWAPSLLLLVLKFLLLLLFVRQTSDISQEDATEFLDVLETIRVHWAGGLIVAAVALLATVGEIRFRRGNYTLVWAMAWGPFALIRLEAFPEALWAVASLAPIMILVLLLSSWSRNGDLYLGEIMKKVVVYLTAVLVLLAAYAAFIVVFQALLGTKISSAAHETVLGIAIMFAAITYAPARHWAGELLDRMVYGKRLASIRKLTDFATMNRADTRIDDFLLEVMQRLGSAFALEKSAVYKVAENARTFRSVEPHRRADSFVFETVPSRLLAGELMRGHQVQALDPTSGKTPFSPNDFICPIRVSGELSALLVFSLEGNNPRLNPEERRLLESLLHQCDVLMENMDLYHAVTQKAISINQLKEYNENIIESSRIGILTTDEMDRGVSCNHALTELVGRGKASIMGARFDELLTLEKLEKEQRVRAGLTVEGRFRNATGEVLLLEIQRNPLKTRENEVYGTLYFIEDIKEKKELNEKLMQQERLASIGMLAAGVAHEINTPLTGIGSYAQLLAGDPEMDEDKRELITLIRGQSQRAARIVSELLNFSRRDTAPKGPVDLVEVLDQTLRFMDHRITRAGVRVTIVEPREQAIIDGYSDQIQQVFVNLTVNAIDAMPDGGSLEVRIETLGRRIQLSFSDTGIGMDEATRNHIFDPFFTTKEVGKGTGLGLAVVYNILQDHGASVSVTSESGEGCTFLLTFDRARRREEGETEARASSTTVTR